MCKEPKQTFFQIRYTDGQQVHENVFNITNDQGNANQNHNELSHHTPQKMAANNKRQEINKY